MLHNYALAFGVFVLAAAVPVCLAAEAGMVERLAACSAERDDAVRLACYDREVAQLVPLAGKQAASLDAPNNKSQANTPESAEDAFGVYGSEVARKRGAEENKAAELKRITAAVTAISQRPRGELVVRLDNGQAWQQKELQPYFPIKVGDEVTVTRGALGSYHLAVAGRSMQVTRIQ